MASEAPWTPVFVVGPPRSGAAVLLEALKAAGGVFVNGDGSQDPYLGLPGVHPRSRGWFSDALDGAQASPFDGTRLAYLLLEHVRDSEGRRPTKSGPDIVVADRLSAHSLRIPFLAALYPGARFIRLRRSPLDSISSTIEAWQSARFVRYPRLPGWRGSPWSFPLVAEWPTLVEMPLWVTVTRQWLSIAATVHEDLQGIDRDRTKEVSFDDLVTSPTEELARIHEWLDVQPEQPTEWPLPLSRLTLSTPERDKWRRRVPGLAELLAEMDGAQVPGITGREENGPVGQTAGSIGRSQPTRVSVDAGPGPFDSSHTDGFPELLGQLSISLLASTYQTGRVICLRDNGGALNTLLREFHTPMGLARSSHRLAIGTKRQIAYYVDDPRGRARFEASEGYDAAVGTRSSYRQVGPTPAAAAVRVGPLCRAQF